MQVSSQPDPAEMAAYYASHDYRREYGPAALLMTQGGVTRRVQPGDPDYERTLDHKAEIEAGEVARTFEAIGKPSPRVLEVGCGEGRMLSVLESMGANVTGIEPDEEAARKAAARLKSGEVHATTLELAALKPPYDVVTSWHVLEHAFDPVATLRLMRGLLADDGWLVIEVPNLAVPGLPLDTGHWQHVHLYDFEAVTLAATLARAGFGVVETAQNRELGTGSWLRVFARKGPFRSLVTGLTGDEVAARLDAVRKVAA